MSDKDVSKSVDLILSAVKSAGEAALRLHEESESLRSRLADYELLKRAVNETGDCLPDCDSYAHNEQCPNVNNHVVLQDKQREIESLRSRLASTQLELTHAANTCAGQQRRAEDAEARLADLEAERELIVQRAENAEAALEEADERHSRYVKAVRELAGMAAKLIEADTRCEAMLGGIWQCVKPKGHEGHHTMWREVAPTRFDEAQP